jgi:hypothetical protein
MHLIYTTNGGLLGLHVLAEWVSWTILIGALYGALRLLIDVVRLLDRVKLPPKGYTLTPPSEPEEPDNSL